ncbi:hypothetical protein N825_34180 [Skermanella stibiiresistens SB22]|uniref:Uncharacterized protein n=1 Tax=Skermanella stibiiresistens SB22 TaxID=1385369 RepID=W9GT08_9PROT|nr:hypothetical protein [Skermanella stibiiresistens]EWY35811.1 hypothetical protein N825_34180 [Skermanella stibiiresistens SB22]
MGAAKNRARREAHLFTEIEGRVHHLGIGMPAPGFYDDSAFLHAGQADPKLIELYAQYVQHRPRTAEEDARTSAIVPRLTAIIARQVAVLERPGACVDGSLLLSRSLDRLGVWNYIAAGGFNAELTARRALGKRYLWVVDRLDPGAGQLGHVWVVAPPFAVVDATIKSQGWDAPFAAAMPDWLAASDTQLAAMTVEDIIASEVREAYFRKTGQLDSNLHRMLRPDLVAVSEKFPGRKLEIGSVRLRYLPTGICASDDQLEGIGTLSGLDGARIWADYIVPAFATYPE